VSSETEPGLSVKLGDLPGDDDQVLGLVGTTLSIVRRQLDRLGVSQRIQEITPDDLPEMAGAVVMNS
jgi:hypothetical protein